jgi:hypothetical protein
MLAAFADADLARVASRGSHLLPDRQQTKSKKGGREEIFESIR